MIYIELCYAIITNFFIIPTSSDSLLTFIASEPASPRSMSSRSLSTLNGPPSPSSRRPARPRARRYNSSISLDGSSYPKRASPFFGLISGDQDRDFEDIGGWRYLAPSNPQNPDQSSPPSSDLASISGVDTAEERAWLSINQRLELPSHHLTLGGIHVSEPGSWMHSATPTTTHLSRPSHHKRSVTTSMLFPSRPGGGLSLALSNRPETPSALSTPTTPGNHRRLSQTGLGGLSDGYFPHGAGNEGHASGCTTPRTGGSGEERGVGLGRFMVHYPAGVRHRRRSVSGVSRVFGREGIH